MSRFRLLRTPPLSGAENMALDEALLGRARRTGECVLRTYAWHPATLSLGRHQSARGLYAPARLEAEGLGVVRRPTGGRAILHHREVTYSVTAPLDALAPPGAPMAVSLARINRLLLHALHTLGVPAHEAVPAGRAPLPDGAPCFEVPTGGELVLEVGGAPRKLVGSAQWRDEGALLQHGSILLDDDQSRVAGLAERPSAPIPPPATLRDALGRGLDREAMVVMLADALEGAVRALEDPGAAPLALEREPDLIADRDRLAERYRDPEWTWRR